MPPDFAMPYLRYAKLLVLRAEAALLASNPLRKPGDTPPSFIVGCGRSGTTILGKVFIRHPEVTYFREPYHYWRKIDVRTDVTGLHGSTTRAKFFMDASDRTEAAQRKFDRLIAAAARPGTRVIEKLPHNVARIGWLESLTKDARYVHIVRNGLSVAKSVERLTLTQPYKMAFKSNYNQWWGVHESKWRCLKEGGKARGWFVDEVDLLESHRQRGAYEWLTSLREADRWREELGDRFMEITYSTFTADPEPTLRALCDHLGLSVPDDWRDHAVALVRDEEPPTGFEVNLPPTMRQAFNEYQERYAFEGRAGAMETGAMETGA